AGSTGASPRTVVMWTCAKVGAGMCSRHPPPLGAVMMILGGVGELLFGAKTQRESLENIAKPLAVEDSPKVAAGPRTGRLGEEAAVESVVTITGASSGSDARPRRRSRVRWRPSGRSPEVPRRSRPRPRRW